jgi:hypothetical protein
MDEPIFAVDLICGKQGRTPTGRGAMPERFPVWPDTLTAALRKVVKTGGNLLVSGANILSDAQGGAAGFTEEVLGCTLANAFGTHTGTLADMPFSSDMNPDIYCVECPDALKPGKGAKAWLRYPGSGLTGAVYYQADNFRTVSLGVPLETVVRAADREWILREVMDYLYNGKRPANRR